MITRRRPRLPLALLWLVLLRSSQITSNGVAPSTTLNAPRRFRISSSSGNLSHHFFTEHIVVRVKQTPLGAGGCEFENATAGCRNVDVAQSALTAIQSELFPQRTGSAQRFRHLAHVVDLRFVTLLGLVVFVTGTSTLMCVLMSRPAGAGNETRGSICTSGERHKRHIDLARFFLIVHQQVASVERAIEGVNVQHAVAVVDAC